MYISANISVLKIYSDAGLLYSYTKHKECVLCSWPDAKVKNDHNTLKPCWDLWSCLLFPITTFKPLTAKFDSTDVFTHIM